MADGLALAPFRRFLASAIVSRYPVHVELTVVGWIVSLVGSGTVGGLITHWLQSRARRQERMAAQVDAHRNELRRVYAEFISACTHFLDLGQQFAAAELAIESQGSDGWRVVFEMTGDREQADLARRTAADRELIMKSRTLLDQYLAASSELDAKVVAVLLLEDETSWAEAVRHANESVELPSPRKALVQFGKDLQERRERLAALTKRLEGTFAPTKWDPGTGTRPR